MLRSIFALLFLCSLPVRASEAPAGQEITMAEYMSHEFFRPYFAKGSQVVWEQCIPLFSRERRSAGLPSEEKGLESVNKVVPVACLWAVLWLSNWALPRWQEETFQAPQEHRRRLDVMLDLLGESRTLLARYLWFTAENYHDMLEKQGANGFQEKDVIPLYRMIAYLDPKVEEAFDILAADMWFGFHDVEKSLEIVNEGLDYNPKSYLLNYRKAFTLIRSQRFAEAVAPAQLMLQYAKSDIDTLNSCRLLYSCYEDQKRYDEALKVLDIWIELRPQDERPRHEREKALKALGRTS